MTLTPFAHRAVLLSIVAATLMAGTVSGQQTVGAAASLRQAHQRLRGQWVAKVQAIISQCEATGHREHVNRLGRLIARPPSDTLVFHVLPSRGTGRPARRTPADRCQAALSKAGRQYARQLFQLAEAAFRSGQIAYCYDLLREVLEADPDYGAARALLGFTRYRQQWVSPYAAQKLKSGYVWHPSYGWVPKGHVARYEQGQRFWKGRWLPAEQVAAIRRQWANAWEIETAHYRVRTNTSRQQGVALAAKLEKLYAIFFRLFAGFFTPREQMALLFDASGRRTVFGPLTAARPRRRFRVHYYQQRREYVQAAQRYVPFELEPTTGVYVPATKTAYFYADPQMEQGTLIHEATHQLFSETRPSRPAALLDGNYWVIEGIACYMESFQDNGETVELGSWETPRLAVGRRRILNGQYVPIDKFVRLGMRQFDGSVIHLLYSQAACLCHFFIHYDQGVYRQALVQYLVAVYSGQADADTLSELTGASYAELDRQFRGHLEKAGQR